MLHRSANYFLKYVCSYVGHEEMHLQNFYAVRIHSLNQFAPLYIPKTLNLPDYTNLCELGDQQRPSK